VTGHLNDKQREILLRPLNPSRVLSAQGQSHLPAYDVEAHLTRVFGFEGWDREITDLWLIHETGTEKNGRVGWTVTYGCRLRLTVRDPSGAVVKTTDGAATGSANNLPSRGDAHDFAMKNADSYALKRAAKAWGDQFGLSLYNKGSVKPLVKTVVAYGEDAPVEYEAPESMGNDEREMVVEPPHDEYYEEPPSVDNHLNLAGRVYVASGKQVGMIRAQFRELAITERDRQIEYVQRIVGEREIKSLTELSVAEASAVINEQNEHKQRLATEEVGE
jgi:Rad52/22 family double-strand break repair protein